MAKMKKNPSDKQKQPCGTRMDEFKGYDVSNLPEKARPFSDHDYKGSHSYTVNVGEAVPCFHNEMYTVWFQGDPWTIQRINSLVGCFLPASSE